MKIFDKFKQRIKDSFREITIISGDNVIVAKGHIKIDGEKYEFEEDFCKNIIVNVSEGAKLQSLSVLGLKNSVHGDVHDVSSMSGDIEVLKDVKGNVSTQSGDVEVKGSIHGDATTMSGDIEAKGPISGKMETMSGDISIKS